MRPTLAAVAAALTAFALLLAGCGSPSEPARPSSTVGPDVQVAEDSPFGAISGVVVDQSIRPLAGATVAIVGTDLKRTTDAGGLFAFEDLEPGTYFLDSSAIVHDSVQSSVEVMAGEVSRVRILLEATGAVQGYHQTIHFKGYIEASPAASGPILNIILDEFGDNPLCTCSLDFNTTGLDLKTIVVEALWEDTLDDPRGPTDLYLEVYPANLDDDTADIQGGFLYSPILEHYPIEAWGEDETNTDWNVRLSGSADHVNYGQTYDLFVTLFVNEPAPDGWSLAKGDV